MANVEPETQNRPSPPPAASAGRRLLPRWASLSLKIAGGVLGTLILAVVVVGVAVDFGSVIEKQIVAQAPNIQAKLGRNLRVGSVHLRLLPTTRLEVRDIALEAQPGQQGLLAQPLLSIGAVRARVAILPLIFTLGRRIAVDRFEVADLRVQVIRTADGKLSYEDILEKLGDQPESAPMTQAEIDRLAGIVLRQASLSDGAILFFDLSTPYGAAAPIKVDGIQFSLTEARLFEPFSLTLDMAVLAAQRNFHLGMTLGPLPPDLQVRQPVALLRKVDLEILPIELEPLLRFLPPSPGVGLSRARIEAKLALETPLESGQLKLGATFAARGLQLEQAVAPGATSGQRRGQPLDVKVGAQLSAALLPGDVKLDKLELALNDMSVTAEADLRSLWTTPAVHALKIASHGLLLEKLLAALPAVSLPKDSDIRGPLQIRGAASGSPAAAQVEVAVDLTPATIMLPSLAKPAGTALSLELRGQVQNGGAGAQGMTIERLGLTLGPLALLLRGQVKSADDLDLKVDTGLVDLDKVFRLLPTVEKSMSKGSRIDGDLRVSGNIKKDHDTLQVGANVTMKNALIDQGDLDLRGGAELQAQIKSTPSSASISADLDLTGAQLKLPGSVDKDRGVPMRLRAQLERTARVVQVRLAELTLPGGTVRVNGRADMGNGNLDIKVPLVDLDLARLSKVVPALQKSNLSGLMDGKLKIALSIDGNPNKLSTVHARLDEFSMTASGGSLKGGGELYGADQPRKITFNFVGDHLDLDRLLGTDKEPPADAETGHGSSDTPTPRWVKALDLNGRIQVDSGKLKGAAVRDFLLEITMSGGKLLIKTLRGQALGGNISASGSTIDLGPSRPRFALRAKLDRIDIGDVMALRGGNTAKKISGRGSMDLSADGNGLSWADIAPRVTGLLGMGLTNGHIEGAGVAPQVVNPLLSQLGKQFAQSGGNRDMTLRDLQAQFRIENGRLQTTTPIKINTEEGALALSGSIGLDKSLNLTGSFDLQPKTISAATGGKVVPANPIPVSLRIGGSLNGPQMQIVDIGRTVAALLQAVARGRGADLLQKKGGGALAPLLGGGNQLGLPGAQPATPGAPPTGTAAPATVPANNPVNNAAKPLEQLRKSGLGGLFGR